ncbi:MAG TPA: DUF2975 domain-containing protein [Saprospiraceae bacterium]|nr:DUF2975 domain-containing protein [Saprospiraceae bacterium]
MKTEKILMILRVLAWVTLVGYAVNFVAQLFRFGWKVLSQTPPGSAETMASSLTQDNLWDYVRVMSFILVLSGMFVYLWYWVTKLLSGMSLSNPFTMEVAQKMEGIAYILFNIWVVSMIGSQVTRHISLDIDGSWDVVQVSTEFLLIAGIVYIISQVYKHGVALQQEQDLTI